MVTSKILTVSYGTFSCTAEGFEDPLAVVKDTTHFFRGVVGEDRFFGAEPPQFDPELAGELMRQQIAAESHDGKLTLRPAVAAVATSSGAMAAALTAGPARVAATLPDDDTIEAAAAEAEARAAAEAAEQAAAEAQTASNATDATDAIAKMNLSSDSQADSTPAQTAATVSAPQPAPEPLLALDASLLADMAADSAADLTVPDAPEAGSDYNLDALLPDMGAATVEAAISAPAPRLADPASVAAKLDRIRAVVAEAPSATTDDDVFIEDDVDAEDDSDLDAILGSLQDGDVEDDSLDFIDDEEEETAEDVTGSIANLMSDLDTDEDDTAEALTDLIDTAENNAEDDDAFAAWDEDAGGDTRTDASAKDEDWDWDDEDEIEDEVAEVAEQPAPPPPPATPVAARPAPLRARVVKVKRAEFEKVLAAGQLEEIEDETEETDAIPAVPGAQTSSLSAEKEDELARELAAVKAELAGDFDEDDWDDEDDLSWDDAAEQDTPAAAPKRVEAAQIDWDDEDEDDLAFDDEEVVAEAPKPMGLGKSAPAPVDTGWDDEDDDDWDDTPAAAGSAPLRLDNPVAKPRAGWGDAPDMDELDARAEKVAITEETEDNIRSAVEGVRKAVKMSSPARAMLTEHKVEDNDTSRILDQTNEELEEPEGNRRRSAIAHLRAAVAATKADRLLGRKSAKVEEEMETYREDLSAVVRPRRPQTGTVRTERPAEAPAQRPAPLKLVAEQRVEQQAAAPAQPVTPVRPRRVNRDRPEAPTRRDALAPAAEAPANGGDFAAYAESVGASELSDLLEAAAAYMSFVEGRDQFSRPQLMSTVRQAEDSESSREDRLRSFGQLLREGKIEKTSGGRFTASDRISFKPDRAAG